MYDESTKKVVKTFEEGSWQAKGHSNRIFCVKFSPDNPNTLLSGGWDQSVFIWDKRQKEPVGSLFGPSISGESIDIKGSMVLTGSYSSEDQMKIWDLRTMEMITKLDWEVGAQCPTAYVYANLIANQRINFVDFQIKLFNFLILCQQSF